MLMVTKKKRFKIAFKNFFSLVHFTQWKSTLVNHQLCTVSQDFYYSGTMI